MWPLLLDLSKDECKRMLRRLELEAYSSIVSVFRAQGDLTKDKKKLLQDLTSHLGISTERHRAEIRRAVNDEKLATIADQVAGSSIASEWAIEGRRLVPLMPRLVPQTAFTSIANNAANVAAAQNACLPLPKDTNNTHAENTPVPQGGVEKAVTKPSATLKAVPGDALQSQAKHSTSQAVQTQPTQMQYEAHLSKLRTVSSATDDIQNSHTVQSRQLLVSAAVQTPEPPSMNNSSNNIVMLPGGMSIHVKAAKQDSSLECDKGRRRKRSSSADISPTAGKTNSALPLLSSPGITSSVAKLGTHIGSSTSQHTVSIPIGGTPLQFTFTGTSQKIGNASSANSANTTGQKVILLSTSCASSLPSSILQRSLSVPVVKTVATTGSTLSQSHPQSKSTSLIASSTATTAGAVTSTNFSTSSIPATFGALTSGSTMSSNSVLPSSSNKVTSVGVSSSNGSLSQVPIAARQTMKQGILVPVTTQASSNSSSTTQTIQLKSGAMITKPTFHIKEGSGLKIITQTLPFSSGTKILPKPSGHGPNIPPILVVKKNTSLTSGVHPGTRVVNVITTQASAGKITPASFTVGKCGATPALVTVGPKGKQAAVVKVSPSMALSAAGGKSNVFVVQKTHMMPSSPAGNAIAIAATPLSTAARSASTSPTVSGIAIQGEKGSVQIENKSTVLADILQAAGILPDLVPEGHSSELIEQTVSSMAENKGVQQSNLSSDTTSGNSFTVEEWMAMGDEAKMSHLTQQKRTETQPGSGPRRLNRSPSVRIQQINLPFELQEGQILEIQDALALVAQPSKFSKVTLDLLRKAGLDLTCDLTAGITSSEFQDDSSGTKTLKEDDVSENLNIHESQTVESLDSSSNMSDPTNEAIQSVIPPVIETSTTKLELRHQEMISESPEESGELDPKTGIYYPYVRTDEEKAFLDGSCTALIGQSTDEVMPTTSSVSLVETTSQQGVDCFPQHLIENQAEILLQAAPIDSSVDEVFNSGKAVTQTQDDIKTSDKCERLDDDTAPEEQQAACTVMKDNIAESQLTHEVSCNEQVEITTKDDVEVLLSPCDTQKMLYCGATYSKEDAASRHKILQTETSLLEKKTKDHQQIYLENSSVDQVDTNVPLSVIGEDSDVTSVDAVQEVLECEEVPFTDCNLTSGVEETVVTTEEKDHFDVVENSDGIVDELISVAKNIPESGDSQVAEKLDIADDGENSETIHSDIAESPPCVELNPSVAFSTLQVSIKDVMSNSKSQSSGSSIFMVTDSVVASDSTSIPMVVPVAEDIDGVDQLDPCDSEKIPIAEVTVHDDGSTSYVVRHQDESEVNYGEEISAVVYQSNDQSCAIPPAPTGSTKLPGKRKRKSSFGAVSGTEDTPNVPHLSGWARSAMGLLLRVMKCRGSRRTKGGLGASHWFLQPVTAEEAPGYHQIVKSPMDLSTVKQKLETFCYKDISEFNQDMMLIKSNCEMYNPPDHEARLDCDEVFTFYQQEYDRLIEKWQKTHLFSTSQKKLKLGM